MTFTSQAGWKLPVISWFLSVSLLAVVVSAQEPAAQPPAAQTRTKLNLLPTVSDSIELVATDLDNLLAASTSSGVVVDTRVFRYVWIPDGNSMDQALVSFVANSVLSRNSINFVPNRDNSPIQYIAGGRLVRLDFFRLVPDDAERIEVLKLWDAIFNPYYCIEDEIIADLFEEVTQKFKVTVPEYVANDGKTYNFKWEDRLVKIRKTKLRSDRVFGPHINPLAGSAVRAHTHSSNPVVWCHTLYDQVLTQRDNGLYYRFMGIRRATPGERKQGLSDFDIFLRSLGVSEKLIDELGAEQRAAMPISKVTGKPRLLSFFNRPQRTGVGTGLITVTHDMNDDDYDPAADPWLNLLEFKEAGREVIFERNNGHLGYLLFDQNGNLVDSAPDKLVADHEIPPPYTRRLEPPISCIRCHSNPSEEGRKDFVNHVRKALEGPLNVFDDSFGQKKNLSVPSTLETLGRLFAGSLEKPMRRAREDHTEAILICTDGTTTPQGLPWKFEHVGGTLRERFIYYNYSPVTPLKACRELGYDLHEDDKEKAATLLNYLLGRLPPQPDLPVQREDIRLGLLKQNDSIHRQQWEMVFIDASMRAQFNMSQMQGPQQ